LTPKSLTGHLGCQSLNTSTLGIKIVCGKNVYLRRGLQEGCESFPYTSVGAST
jgi:hypothetical protein